MVQLTHVVLQVDVGVKVGVGVTVGVLVGVADKLGNGGIQLLNEHKSPIPTLTFTKLVGAHPQV